MARNLLKNGYPVVAFARKPAKAAQLAEAGGSIAESPAALARAADLVVTVLPDAPDVEEVLFGPTGVSEGARAGTVVIDSSSISPIATRAFAARLGEIGVTLLDAPVSGGEKGATEGTLSFMVGGDQPTFERCLPVFEAMGKRITWIGESGAGQIAKACNQAIIAVSLVGISEALLLAARSGVDPGRVREALLGGFASSPLLEVHGQRMLDRTFEPGPPSTTRTWVSPGRSPRRFSRRPRQRGWPSTCSAHCWPGAWPMPTIQRSSRPWRRWLPPRSPRQLLQATRRSPRLGNLQMRLAGGGSRQG
jgi:2-hydroxy-3-oxopropionate reductase